MKIFYYCGAHPNFGDELNSWLWPKLLPGFFDDDVSTHFIGIGSTIGDAPHDASRKIVFGAGYVPHYHSAPDVHDGNWDVRFVRGPRTAARLHLDEKLVISDSGILARTQIDTKNRRGERISFMPHWESMERGNWPHACEMAGITLIDPRDSVDAVFAQLLQSKLVIAEAMHGAIIADALRIPWVATVPLNHVHREKWFDWAESLGIVLRPQKLWPSSLVELSRGASKPATFDGFAASPARANLLSRTKQAMQRSAAAPWLNRRLTEGAAQRLQQLSRVEGMLSRDAEIDDATARMLEKLEQLKRDYR